MTLLVSKVPNLIEHRLLQPLNILPVFVTFFISQELISMCVIAEQLPKRYDKYPDGETVNLGISVRFLHWVNKYPRSVSFSISLQSQFSGNFSNVEYPNLISPGTKNGTLDVSTSTLTFTSSKPSYPSSGVIVYSPLSV